LAAGGYQALDDFSPNAVSAKSRRKGSPPSFAYQPIFLSENSPLLFGAKLIGVKIPALYTIDASKLSNCRKRSLIPGQEERVHHENKHPRR
jgi:hypothetical protein